MHVNAMKTISYAKNLQIGDTNVIYFVLVFRKIQKLNKKTLHSFYSFLGT